MKRIVICFDGTWNKPADENLSVDQQIETNVRRFYEAVLPTGADGVQQIPWYDQGVGSHWYDKYTGGLVGAGLEFNILQGYNFLAETYADGDEIYILGFSRGAYTARSLVGMIRNCGLIKPDLLKMNLAAAYWLYRTRGDGPDSMAAKMFRRAFAREVPVKFLGVWDTVGALGLPLHLLQQFNLHFYEFHDTKLSRIVEHAYHAIAVDEHRKDYDVCLWNPSEHPQQTLEQRWFPGAHTNVGGGNQDRHLSDLALHWIGEKAAAVGLGLKPFEGDQLDCLGPISDSYADFLRGEYAKRNPRYFRTIGATAFGNEVIDPSVQQRMRDHANYRPTNPGLSASA
ncbi:MAG TPA: DUF2235 domain-containing protein [Blastocatellia bacterium]|nr:DUF2235 domain-containing protein [Blastocatellia bacterium]